MSRDFALERAPIALAEADQRTPGRGGGRPANRPGCIAGAGWKKSWLPSPGEALRCGA